MPKNIVLLSDGTGNSAGKLFKTNVWRLYQALDLSGADQIAYYDDGVGSSSFKPMAVLGGAFGWGLKRNVLDLYSFLCWNYQSDDRIYCFGFSRGAFTIRVLTGLIDSQGLIRANTKSELKRLAREAFRAYRQERYRTTLGLERPARMLRNTITRAHSRVWGLEGYRALKTPAGIPITFVGLWDTVAAYGLPIEELTRAWNAFFPLSAPNRNPAESVQRACHALAIDDERKTFHPVLWNEERLPGQNRQTAHIAEETISQVWFAGMHSNVGGGYPDDALAHVSLDWIMGEAEGAGIVFKPEERARLRAAMDSCGKLYDSRHGLGGTYRYLPRKIAALTNDRNHPRDWVIIPRPKIHESVFERIDRNTDGYAPVGLPADYAIVTRAGNILDLCPAIARPGAPRLREHVDQARDRCRRQEKVWDLVWRKRLTYSVSIILACALALFPLYRPATAACEGSLCFLSPLIKALGMILPDLAAPWLDAFQTNPASSTLLVVLLAVFISIGGRLEARIFDEMRVIWASIRLAPGVPPASVTGLPKDAIYRLRSNPVYQHFWKSMRQIVLPLLAGTAAAAIILAGMSRGLFALESSVGLICWPTPRALLKEGVFENGRFASNSPCWASGVTLRQGKRYRLTLKPVGGIWRDGDIPVVPPSGFESGDSRLTKSQKLLLLLGVPLRRHIVQPWFLPIARIGHKGSDDYPLESVNYTLSGQRPDQFIAEIVPRHSGELFLFVNDAVLPVPNSWQYFYSNNDGIAAVTVRPIEIPNYNTTNSNKTEIAGDKTNT